jgi:decaprenyl-phosphate phosphoribosyltransferase
VAYCEFALERADQYPSSATWVLLSTIPFIVAILRYALLVEQGQGSAPEELLFNDRQMQVIGLVWVALMALSVYAH